MPDLPSQHQERHDDYLRAGRRILSNALRLLFVTVRTRVAVPARSVAGRAGTCSSKCLRQICSAVADRDEPRAA
jgi:hypothetical protein